MIIDQRDDRQKTSFNNF